METAKRARLLTSGSQIGNYVIERLLGSGGQSDVYLARDVVLRRAVAVKLLQGAGEWESKQVEEARLVATLDHPHIVRVYHVEVADPGCYMVMEYVEGGTLDQFVARHGPLSPKLALDLAMAALDALHHAHTRRIVHRDIKPTNLLVTRAETPKIVDFGLATLQGGTSDLSNTSNANTKKRIAPSVVGTPQYMAPEIWRGKGATEKSDVYSLGGCLYFMLTGVPPYRDRTVDALKKAHLERIVGLPTAAVSPVPRVLIDLIRRAMEKNEANRPDAAAFYDGAQLAYHTLTGQRRSPSKLTTRAVAPKHAAEASMTPQVIFQLRSRRAFEEALFDFGAVSDLLNDVQEGLQSGAPLVVLGGASTRIATQVLRVALEGAERDVDLAARLDLRPSGQSLFQSLLSLVRVPEALGRYRYEAILSHLRLRSGLPQDDRTTLLFVQFHRRIEAGDLGDLVEILPRSREAKCQIVVACDLASADDIQGVLAASELSDLARFYSLRPVSPSDLVRFTAHWTAAATDQRLRWTRDSLLMLLDAEAEDHGAWEHVVQNATFIALENRLPLVTTWCVLGARSHEALLQEGDELDPRWRTPEPSWPSSEVLARLPALRRQFDDILKDAESAGPLATTGAMEMPT